MNILFAFDDDLSPILKSHFEPENYTLSFTNDGQQAVEKIITEQPDVVVLDYVLKTLDGFGVLNQINELKLANKPKFIFASAVTQSLFIKQALEYGAVDFLARPFNVESLKNHIKILTNGNAIELPKKENLQDKMLEEQVTNMFLSIGIPANIKGYQYLKEAVKLTYHEPHYINNITKELYPAIARKVDSTPAKVERAIRHAIEIAWCRGKLEVINDIFGIKIYSRNERPTNSEFIALVTDKMLQLTI